MNDSGVPNLGGKQMPKTINFPEYYEPFGEAWRDEMMRLTKKELISLLRKNLMEKKTS